MLFDTHAHYDDDQFDGDRETLLASLPEQGVGLVVNPGCTVASSRTAVELARRFPHVYAAVGIHPENCGDFRPEDLDAIRALAREDKVVAIGEIGLDYYWLENPPRPLQQQVLRSQLALARELSLPVIIHDRDAHADTMAIVREFPGLRGVFHCFAGSVEMARELVDMGWYLSFNGAATFKNARKAPDDRNGRPLPDPGALPGPPQRLHLRSPGGGEDRPAAGHDPGSGGAGHLGQWKTLLRNLILRLPKKGKALFGQKART